MRRCPKCKGAPSSYTEVWENYLEFNAVNGIPEEEGYLHPGHATSVKAHCSKCGHNWKLKMITQITELQP